MKDKLFCECGHVGEGESHNYGGPCSAKGCLCEGVEYQENPPIQKEMGWGVIGGLFFFGLASLIIAFACIWHWKPR